jgi:hypothetical protein
MKIKRYNNFILEKYDNNIRKELIRMGITNKVELEKQVNLSKQGHLGQYLHENGKDFTFGILKAIFKDAKIAKKRTDIKKDTVSLIPRILPLALIPFYPMLAIIGTIMGSSRAFNRAFKMIYDYIEPHSKYSDFLRKMVDTCMKIPEGNIELKDRFSRAFVVSDRLIDAIKPEVINEFTNLLCKKMEEEDDSKIVPDNYIENELKKYINDNFDVNPKIGLK